MERFLEEIRERGVLRAAGLYVALVWLVLQIADIVFPAFDIPDSAVRYVLYGAIALFPAVLLFSWFYEITTSGVVKEEDANVTQAERASLNRKMALLTIFVLVAALATSVFFNVQQVAEEPPAVAAPPDNISLLIADTVNNTGDPIFEGVLEQALSIGLEGASFINLAPRHHATRIADENEFPGVGLALERARLVAVRGGAQLVLVGEIAATDNGYQLSLQGVAPDSGDTVLATGTIAADKSAVLQAVASLTDEARKALGDVSLGDDPGRETFTTASLEAMNYYTRAQAMARDGKDSYAVALYQQAVEADPNFGRAYSGWALAEFNLGQVEKSNELWQKTLSMLDGMTERERYRTLGLYYSLVTNNHDKAIENYRLLVEKFPADGVAHNNLAVVYFMNRQFDEALIEGGRALDIYPNNTVLRSNNALYAMYLGDFELASRAADRALEVDASFHKPYLAKAIAELAAGDFDGAREQYELMARQGGVAASLASSGLADLALYRGQPQQALDILRKGVRADVKAGNERGAQTKQVMSARANLALGDHAAAADELLGLTESDSIHLLVPAGRAFVALGNYAAAEAIQQRLAAKLLPEERAAGDLVQGNIHLSRSEFAEALDAFNASLGRVDSWLARFDRGRAYAEAGYYAEALTEFQICEERLGEASALFLDDQPTFHYSAELPYWLGRARANLGNNASARKSLEQYIALQGAVDSKQVADARDRLEALPAL